MDKEILKEIKSARKEAINDMLKDIGFFNENRNREKKDIKKEVKIEENIDKTFSLNDKTGFDKFIYSLNFIGKIKQNIERKEQEYYREKIAKILEDKDNLVNRTELR